MSKWDWPKAVRHWYEIECSRCWALSSTLIRDLASAVAVESHRDCHPAVATVLRRGEAQANAKRSWTVWLHTGE
jgi:hypothetical protein